MAKAAKEVQLPEIYFELKTQAYFFPLVPGQYSPLAERKIKNQLRLNGIDDLEHTDESGMSKADRIFAIAERKNYVHYAGPLAGYQHGFYQLSGDKRILVTQSVKPIQAGKSTKIPRFEKYFDQLLGSEQALYFMCWLKVGLTSLNRRDFMPGQLMGIVGEPGSSKGFLSWLTKILFGGRSGDPYAYMTGGTPFNGELAQAEFWSMGDKQAKYDIRSRRAFGAAVKSMCVDSEMFIHPKGQQAFNADTFRRLMLTSNPEREHVQVFPPMDNDIRDKVMLFKCHKATMLHEDKLQNQKEFLEEMPNLVAYLQQESIPAKLKDPRYGVKAYQDEELREMLDVMTPERQLLEIIDESIDFEKETGGWRGTAEALKSDLLRGEYSNTVFSLLNWTSACGTYLDRLSRKFPERFDRKTNRGKTVWTIKPESAEPTTNKETNGTKTAVR
jgi:hypothetical protein